MVPKLQKGQRVCRLFRMYFSRAEFHVASSRHGLDVVEGDAFEMYMSAFLDTIDRLPNQRPDAMRSGLLTVPMPISGVSKVGS
jgi:hypothetical protein